ncbi:MAG: branched-chain amino acid ABC transporter permease [Actinobacteria bacterium]|nr:branched-chain amino acid ABC transporter permease [Actinomycetota bacterium]
MSSHLLLQAVVLGVLTGGVYSLWSAGLTLIFGVMRVVNIAHAAFLVLSAYLSWFAYTELGIDPLLSLFATVPAFFVVGVLIQRLLLARLRDHVTMMSVLLTTALAITIEGSLGMLWTGSHRGIEISYSTSSFSLAGISFPSDQVIGFVLAALTFFALFMLLRHSRYGKALRATIQNPDAASLLGIKTTTIQGIGFGLGLATAAVGGLILGLIHPFFPATHWAWIARIMAIIVLGGLGSVTGAALAALLMGVIESVVLVTLSPVWAGMIFYLVLAGTLVFRPHGFFGGRLAERF